MESEEIFISEFSSLGDRTVYGRKVHYKNISIIDSAFCGQTFLWNKGLIPESDQEYTEISGANTHIIRTAINSEQSPTDFPEMVWIVESMGETFIHSTSKVLCLSLLDDRFNLDIDPVEEFRQFITNLGFERDYRNKQEIPNITLVSDPTVDCLLQFICSQQMGMDRIHSLNNTLKQEFGEKIELGEYEFYAYPTDKDLEDVSEEEFRELSFGYRSEYLTNTVNQIIEENPLLPLKRSSISREELHRILTEYYGVGDKIADCVQLYAYNQSVVPMDTWTKKLAEALEPDAEFNSYSQYQSSLEKHFRSGKEGIDQLFAYDLLTSDDHFLTDVSNT